VLSTRSIIIIKKHKRLNGVEPFKKNMPDEIKTCQNCKKDFTIEPDDFAFYEKMKVPAPTFCPDCRFQRRMARRNERVLTARQCDGTKDRIISCYDESVPFPVYKREFWYSDKWDPLQYARDYDFSKPFFEQFKELSNVAPRLQLWLVNSVNSDYSNYVGDSKDCYLCFTAFGNNEQCSYCAYLNTSTNCLDCYLITKCELCYECLNCDTCYNVKYSIDAVNCRDSWFLYDCTNCTDCFGCVGLRNKQYHIFNEQYSKEEYTEKIKEFNLDSRQNIPDLIEKVKAMALKFPRRFMHGRKNENVSGDYVNNSNNARDAYFVNNNEDCRWVYFTLKSKSFYDVTVSTLGNELIYESHAIPKSNYFLKFCDICSNGCRNMEYCSNCDSSSYCFGCIGVRGKEYCILNKQYTKEEYEELIPKIIKHMDEMPYVDKNKCTYKYGEFFPADISPFAYNESMAQECFPLTKETAIEQGYAWKNLKPKNYKATISSYKIPDAIKDVADDITSEILQCSHEGNCAHNCTHAFRVIPTELEFYRRLNLPLPKLCPNCRHHRRLAQRNPLKLWDRTCAKCGKEIKTSYAPGRPEIVCCEACYQQEVS